MSAKAANLIAGQLGILIGLMSWLVYSQFQSAKPQPSAIQDGAGAPFEAAAHVFETETQRPESVAYSNPQAVAQPVYQPQIQPVQYQYYQQPAQQPVVINTADFAGNSQVADDSSSYSEAIQEPATAQVEYYVAPSQSYNYYGIANQVVVTNGSQQGRDRNRCQQPPNGNVPPGNNPRHVPPDRGGHNVKPPATTPLPPIQAPPPPPSQGVKPPRPMAPPINPIIPPRKVVFPAPPRTVRPNAAVP